MNKFLAIPLSLLLLLFCYSQEINPKIFENALYPTIMVMDHENQTGGTGFLVRSTKVGDKYYLVLNSDRTTNGSRVVIPRELANRIPSSGNLNKVSPDLSLLIPQFGKL